MRNFSGGNRSDRGRDFGKKRGRDSGRPSMHQATCNSCGTDCEVPFKPTSGKPIYCSKCFDKSQNEEPKKYGRDRRSKSGDSRKRNFDDRDFSSNKSNETEQLKKEIKILSAKVDQVLDILNELLAVDENLDEYDDETE